MEQLASHNQGDSDRDEFDKAAVFERERQLKEADEKRKRDEEREIEAAIAKMPNRPATTLDTERSHSIGAGSNRSSNNSSIKRRRYLRKIERQQAH